MQIANLFQQLYNLFVAHSRSYQIISTVDG